VDEELLSLTVEGEHPAVVRMTGELDVSQAPRLLSVLTALDGDVELHCPGLSFINAAGVSVLLKAHARCAERGHKLVITEPSRAVRRVLGILDLDRVLFVRGDSTGC
jgi:anti-anti-sigma factor